jgi:hypothetical protein
MSNQRIRADAQNTRQANFQSGKCGGRSGHSGLTSSVGEVRNIDLRDLGNYQEPANAFSIHSIYVALPCSTGTTRNSGTL